MTNQENQYFVSKRNRMILSLVGPDRRSVLDQRNIDEMRAQYPDVEIMREQQWIRYVDSLVISQFAELSNQETYERFVTHPHDNIINRDDRLHFFFYGEPFVSDIALLFACCEMGYFSMHERISVTADQVWLKIQLCIAHERIRHMEEIIKAMNAKKVGDVDLHPDNKSDGFLLNLTQK